MKYTIYFWYGRTDDLVAKLLAAGAVNECGTFYFTGTLDEFASRYNDRFIYMPGDKVKYICVSQYKGMSWGAR